MTQELSPKSKRLLKALRDMPAGYTLVFGGEQGFTFKVGEEDSGEWCDDPEGVVVAASSHKARWARSS